MITFPIFVLIILKAKIVLSWYFYPIILLFLLLTLTTNLSNKVFALIIISNFLINSPVIFAQLSDKIIHIKNHYNKSEINTFITHKKSEFAKIHQDYYECTAIDPPSGSCIIEINDHLNKKNLFKKPTFLAVSKIMIIGNNDSVYSHLKETFNDEKMERFKKEFLALDQQCENCANFLESYKDVYVFSYVPVLTKN